MAGEIKFVEIKISDEWKALAREVQEAREWLLFQVLSQHVNSCPLCRPVAVEGEA